jgi:hypothetical protein
MRTYELMATPLVYPDKSCARGVVADTRNAILSGRVCARSYMARR